MDSLTEQNRRQSMQTEHGLPLTRLFLLCLRYQFTHSRQRTPGQAAKQQAHNTYRYASCEQAFFFFLFVEPFTQQRLCSAAVQCSVLPWAYQRENTFYNNLNKLIHSFQLLVLCRAIFVRLYRHISVIPTLIWHFRSLSLNHKCMWLSYYVSMCVCVHVRACTHAYCFCFQYVTPQKEKGMK